VLNIVPIGGLTTELQTKITELHPAEPADAVGDDAAGRARATS